MNDNEWNDFWVTGSVDSYLKYKEKEKVSHDGDNNKGFSNTRADNRGE